MSQGGEDRTLVEGRPAESEQPPVLLAAGACRDEITLGGQDMQPRSGLEKVVRGSGWESGKIDEVECPVGHDEDAFDARKISSDRVPDPRPQRIARPSVDRFRPLRRVPPHSLARLGSPAQDEGIDL